MTQSNQQDIEKCVHCGKEADFTSDYCKKCFDEMEENWWENELRKAEEKQSKL